MHLFQFQKFPKDDIYMWSNEASLGALQELVKLSSRTYQPDRFSVKFDIYLAKYWMRGVNLRLFQYTFGTHP